MAAKVSKDLAEAGRLGSAIHAWNARSEPDLHQKHSRLIAPSELTDLPLLYTAGIQNGEQKLAHECGRFSTQPTLEKGSH